LANARANFRDSRRHDWMRRQQERHSERRGRFGMGQKCGRVPNLRCPTVAAAVDDAEVVVKVVPHATNGASENDSLLMQRRNTLHDIGAMEDDCIEDPVPILVVVVAVERRNDDTATRCSRHCLRPRLLLLLLVDRAVSFAIRHVNPCECCLFGFYLTLLYDLLPLAILLASERVVILSCRLCFDQI